MPLHVSNTSAHRQESSLNLCTGWPPIGVMIPETVEHNFGLLTMSSFARNM